MMYNPVILQSTCSVSELGVIGNIYLYTTPFSIIFLVGLVGLRSSGVLWSVLEGWFTPKRKVITAKVLNGVMSVFFFGNIVVVFALYAVTPFFVPTSINSCFQPI
jgi:hypothetical protein